MTSAAIDRRRFLTAGTALGCSAAASPLFAPMSFASAPWEERLVVILLRGGLDGLDMIQPYGDPRLSMLRGKTLPFGDAVQAHDLDGFFALHPALGDLMPMWRAGDLAFAHAVSTPYRDKRSHFDGQDLLEAGTGFGNEESLSRDGWLNRLLQVMPGLEADTAYAIGSGSMYLLQGPAPVANWAPGNELTLSAATQNLLEFVYESDPVFHAAASEAFMLSRAAQHAIANGVAPETDAMQQMLSASNARQRNQLDVARFAASRLRADTRVAAFSINGWDTHARQSNFLPRQLKQLADTVLLLKAGLGSAWEKTAIVAVTEFGRTARANGSEGTDHGTAGAMLMAGGAIKGGKVFGKWPGLQDADLYAQRDLMPTADVRGYLAAVMHGLLAVDKPTLENTVFPGFRHDSDISVIA